MINKITATIFFFLLVLPLCSSIQIEMKSSYDLGENFIAKISGNFLEPISKEDISFYRRHMPTIIDFSLTNIDNDYYVYAQVPFEKIPDNYSILIQGIKSFQGTQVKEENIFHNFSITNKTADFFVNPPVLVTNTDFIISVQNLQDKIISITISLPNQTTSSGGFFSFFTGGGSKELSTFSLGSGEAKNVDFKIENFTEGRNLIKINSESLETFVQVKAIKEKEKPKFSFERSKINLFSMVNSTESKKVFISNSGRETIKNISLSLSDSLKEYVNLSTSLIEELKADTTEEITLTFFSEEEVYLEGFLKAEKEDNATFLSLYFNSTEGYKPVDENDSEENQTTSAGESSQTCSEQNGTPCGEGFNCTGTLVDAKDDRCCIGGECKKIGSSATKKIIGWSLLILSILILYLFLTRKYLGTKNKVVLPNSLKRI